MKDKVRNEYTSARIGTLFYEIADYAVDIYENDKEYYDLGGLAIKGAHTINGKKYEARFILTELTQ